jgi:hypothetical protein
MDLSSLSDEELMHLYNSGGKKSKDLSSMSDQQLMDLYGRLSPPKPPATRAEEKKAQEEPGVFGRLGKEFSRQTESLISSGRTAYETLTEEDKAAVAHRAEERQKKIAEKYGPERGLAEVQKAYEEKGILPAAGEVLYQVPGAIGSILPTMAGGIVGGLVGGPAGAAIGMGAVSGATQLGTNLERQFEKQANEGKPIDPDVGAAAIGALAQAGLDTAGFMIPFGKAIIAPFSKVASKSGTAAAEKLAAESITKTLAKGTAVGMIAEVPTEVAQQMIERYQAGLDLFSDDALKEYAEIAYKTSISVAPLGGPGRMIEKSGAKAQVAKAAADEEEKKRLAAEETQYVGQRQQEFIQADEARRQQEQAQSEEAAKAAGMGYVPKLEAPPKRAEDSAPAPEERTYPELRGDNFVIVGEKSGNPVQGGFRTMEEAKAASDKFNSLFEESEGRAEEEELKSIRKQHGDLLKALANPDYIPIDKSKLKGSDGWLALKINEHRRNRGADDRTIASNITYPAEIAELNIHNPKELSDRLIEEQYPGVKAKGLTIPALGATARGEALINKHDTIDSIPKRMTKDLKVIAAENGIEVNAGTKPLDVINNLRKISGRDALVKEEEQLGKNRPAIVSAQPDSITRQAREQQIAEERASKDWENSPVRPFSEAVEKQQDRVNKLTEAAEKAKNNKAKVALQKRIDKAQEQLNEAQNNLNEAKKKYGVTEGPYRPAEVIGQQKVQEQSKMKAALKTAFDRMGLTKQGISPQVVDYLANEQGQAQRGAGAVEAEYNPQAKTITFASDIYDPNLSVDQIVDKMMDVLNHEIIHSLKAAGLFTKPEWNILENFVKSGEGKRFLERAKIVYPDLSTEAQIEEAVAEAARAFKAGDFKPVGKPRSLFERIINFFKSIFSTAKTNNTTPDAIFNAIRTGEIGGRKATQDAAKTQPMQSRVGDNGGPPLEEKKNWINVPRLLQFLGSQMYKNDIGQVASKELIQNAFDSVKMAQAQGVLLGPGKIIYDYHSKENIMKVSDNGIGMDEDVLRKAFFTVFGSDKKGLDPKERSGGFGLAKLAYLLAAEDIKIKTTKDGVTYRIHTSGEAIKKMYEDGTDIKIDKESTPSAPNGTSVEVKIPKESVDRMSGNKVENSVLYPRVLHGRNRKFIGNAKFYERAYWQRDEEPEEIKELTDLSEFDPPQTKKFSWGEVDVYLGRKLEEGSERAQVLSAGVYQFNYSIMDNFKSPKIKSIFNVKPYNTPAPIDLEEYIGEGKKEGTSTAYPFTPDRENFSEFVKGDLGTLEAIVWKRHNDLVMQSQVKAMSSFYKMKQSSGESGGGFRFKSISSPTNTSGKSTQFEKVDVGLSDIDIKNNVFTGDKSKFPSFEPYFHNNLDIDIVEKAASEHGIQPERARQFFFELGKVVHDFSFKNIAAVAEVNPDYKSYLPGAEERIAGISLDKDYAGVNARFPLSGMYLNPFYTEFFSSRNIKLTPSIMGPYWLRVMKHEAAHEVARGHNNDFCVEEVVLDTLLHDTDGKAGPTMSNLMKRFEKIYSDYLTEYEAMKDVYDRDDTKNNSTSLDDQRLSEGPELEEDSGRKAVRSRDEYVSGRERQEVASGRQEGSEGGFFVPKGMSIEAESVTDQGSVRQKNGPVKQARVGPSNPVNINLNTPTQVGRSNQINQLIINNNRYLSQLTAEEGTRTSQTYKDYIKEVIDPFHMLGKGADKFRIARALLVGNIAEMTRKVNDYVKAIGDAKGDKKAIYDYLTTRGALPDRIGNAEARRAAVAVKDIINDIGDELVRQNLISQNERNRFLDSYLPRVYLAYIDKKHVRGGIKPSYQYYLEHRQDLTEEERTRLGEIDDPAFLVQEALFSPLRDLAILNFFKKINDIGQGQWIIGMDAIRYTNPSGHTYQKSLPELKMFKHRLESMISDGTVEPSRAAVANDELAHLTSFINNVESQLDANVDKGRYIKVAKDPKRFGPLAGVWLARPIYRDIMGMGSFVPNDMSAVAAAFSDGGLMAKATRHFKVAKVAMNPPTIVTNIISNTLMMHFADVPMRLIFPRVASVFKEIVVDKRGRYYDLVHKYGLKETTLSEVELHRLYDELRNRQIGSSGLGNVMGMFNALGRAYGNLEDKASNMYGSIETVFKAAVIKDAIERQGLSEEQAVLKANKYLFDYSEVHDSVKALRNVPFGAPFLTWSYKMTPLLIETALTKPWKFAPYAMLFAGVSMYASAAMTDAGGDPEDKDKMKKFISLKAAQNPMLLAYSPTDAFDFGKYMPFNNIYKFADALLKGDFVEAFKAFGFFGGPIADLGVALLAKKDPFTGNDIFPKGASYDEKVALSFNYLLNSFTPSFMKDMPRFIAGHGISDTELIAGAESPVVNLLKKVFEDPTGKKPGMPTKDYGEIFANIFGFNIYHPSFAQYAMNLNKFNREIDDIKTGRRNALMDPTLSKGEIESINKKYTKMLEEKSKELRDFVKDSKISPQVMEVIRQSVEGTARSK